LKIKCPNEIIKEIIENSPKHYQVLHDFSNSDVYDDNIAAIRGEFTEEVFKNGKDLFEQGKNREAIDTYLYYMITMLNRINKHGQNGAPTYQQVLNTIFDTLTEVENGKEIITYEQESILTHTIGFLFNPDNSFFADSQTETQKEDLINKTLSIRGYGGAGKSTVFLSTLLKTFDRLRKQTGKKLKVTIFTPGEALAEDLNKYHQKNHGFF